MRNAITQFALCGLALFLLVGSAIAADINGTWNFAFIYQGSEHPRTMTLTVNGDQVTVKSGEDIMKGTFRNGKLEIAGERFDEEAGYKATFKLSGTLEGDQIKGTATWDTYDLTFTATRVK